MQRIVIREAFGFYRSSTSSIVIPSYTCPISIPSACTKHYEVLSENISWTEQDSQSHRWPLDISASQACARLQHGKSQRGLTESQKAESSEGSLGRKSVPKAPSRHALWKPSQLPRSRSVQERTFSTTSQAAYPTESARETPKPTPVVTTSNSSTTVRPRKENIRQRLRRWETENVDTSLPSVAPSNLSKIGSISNAAKYMADDHVAFPETNDNTTYEDIDLIFEKGELVDFGEQRRYLLPGDMVELSAGPRQELAVFIRNLQYQSQFYTMTGKWIHRRSQNVKFFVPGFIEREALEPLLQYLPDDDVPDILQDRLQTFEHALPRNIGGPIVQKMLDFWKEADVAYRSAASRLDGAHKLVAFKDGMRVAFLQELAKELLPMDMMKNNAFATPALYAVHRKILQDEVSFRAQRQPQPTGKHRAWAGYEISSLTENENIRAVTAVVRKYQGYLVAQDRVPKPPTACASLLRFIEKSRELIRRSRKTRKVTLHGTILPVRLEELPTKKEVLDQIEFEPSDLQYINFMESWSGLRTFGLSSPVHAIASAILRAIGMYNDFELDQCTGWTFLQEIGVIEPWANQAAFAARLNHTSKQLRKEEESESVTLREDVVQELRKDWGDLQVYCIDDVDAQEIDDGVSLERTEASDEYWVHIHTADPSSQIAPNSDIANMAAASLEAVYLPERKIPMINEQIVQSRFSLAPNRPCLTFSARVNSNGDILENKITAGYINNVHYISPSVLDEILGRRDETKHTVWRVGQAPELKPVPRRSMLSADQVSDSDKENLRILHSITSARTLQNSLRGAVTLNVGFMSHDVKVHFNGPTNLYQNFSKLSANDLYDADPMIELRVSEKVSSAETGTSAAITSSATDTVKGLMLLAGVVAAEWCSQRGIPIIYRATQSHPNDDHAADFFRYKILPLVRAGKPPSEEDTRQYIRLLGGIVASTTPGPHVALGVKKYTKCTSPLRRFGDLLLHWQVEAALLEESRTGKSLVGNRREDFLPFTKQYIDGLIPRVEYKEKSLRLTTIASLRIWLIQLLLRAWEVGEAKLPEIFRFEAVSVTEDGRVSGNIPALDGFKAVVLTNPSFPAESVNAGDIFEVKLVDLNSYSRHALFEPVERAENAG